MTSRLTWLLLLALVGCGCSGARADKKGNATMQAMIDSELRRVRKLLDPERARCALKEVPPELPIEKVGALVGIGFKATQPDALGTVYLFEKQGQHAAAIATLRAAVPESEKVRVLYGSNGRLLFFGHARIDGPDAHEAKYRLADIASAFAGDE